MSEADAGSTARILKGPFQLRDSFVLSTVASVSFLAPWRMVEAELYTQAQPPTLKGGEVERTAIMGAFRRCRREVVMW